MYGMYITREGNNINLHTNVLFTQLIPYVAPIGKPGHMLSSFLEDGSGLAPVNRTQATPLLFL